MTRALVVQEMVLDAITSAEIPWHPEPVSYRARSRPLTSPELWTITQIELVLETLDSSETAAWILDLICDRAALAEALHACMDVLAAQQRPCRHP